MSGPDQGIHLGEFTNEEFHGEGRMIYANDTNSTGIWKLSNFVGAYYG